MWSFDGRSLKVKDRYGRAVALVCSNAAACRADAERTGRLLSLAPRLLAACDKAELITRAGVQIDEAELAAAREMLTSVIRAARGE